MLNSFVTSVGQTKIEIDFQTRTVNRGIWYFVSRRASPSCNEALLISFQPPSPAASTISMLNDDTTDLIERLADVQQEKWLLEEKVSQIVFVKR